ncbi:small glutamine-rich tetratricopeptide repeat-containing protein alpha [Pseudoliparis swirei]|uniref:small glutamine-rich tetratricopeptide repeat-containing protein alpha n=1 Tax=Pseudoliparis swirei TaxID=2059687 RepID=UPI0024BDC8F9|nr:small glutamine-rich tetratricopeptide repeat-containing protein alpha [Pseudoliparis swirei]XP_056270063.1 small glutamine-rich tetratricopeptide repeat-containing protein alpha [Pseudoliparis swirei]
MTDNKRLAFSILQFLHDQLQSGNLTSGAQESLEVAVQCLETAYEISTDDQTLAVPMTLPEIFASATDKFPTELQVNNNSASPPPLNSLTEEQRDEAETLKTDGNDQMKVENFAAAVEFYSKAIAMNPQNAVYYCNRAAAYSKLGNYAGAVQDCEQAIGIDPNYSKAYGRMGLALASLNKHTEAATFYKKALELDPDNDTYKTNLKIAEEKIETSSPTAGMGGVDLAGLLSNPGFMNMASSLMTNPQVQQMMSGMMSGAYGGVPGGGAGLGGLGAGLGAGLGGQGAGLGGLGAGQVGGGLGAGQGGGGPGGGLGGSAAPTGTSAGAPAGAPAGAGDLSGLIQAGQQFAQQMQQQNPELIEQLRSQIRNRTPSAGNEEQP